MKTEEKKTRASSQEILPSDWKLWVCNPTTGQEILEMWGEEWMMRKVMAFEVAANRDVWLIDPDGVKHLPTPPKVEVTEERNTEASVCADILRRQTFGLSKYGVSVADNPLSLREWLNHAYLETLDKAVYLKRAMDEIDGKMLTEEKLKNAFNRWIGSPSGYKWEGFKKELGL